MKNRIKYILFLFIIKGIILFIPNGYGQNPKIDSLLTVLKTTKEDTNKVNTLIELAWEVSSNNPDSTILLGNEAILLANKINFLKGKAISYGVIGYGYYYKGDYSQTLKNYFAAIKVDEILNNKAGIANRMTNIGIVFKQQGDYTKALDYYSKAIKIYEDLGDKNKVASVLGNVGSVYGEQGNYPEALASFLKVLKIAEEFNNKEAIAKWNGNIGKVYMLQGDYFNARKYYLKALKISEELGDKNSIAVWLGNIGNVSSPTDAAGPGWTTPGSIDFTIEDIFQYGADNAKFEDVLKRGFIQSEDCFNGMDDNADSAVDCNDYDCQYAKTCEGLGVNAVGYNDTTAPLVNSVKIEEYPDAGFIMYDTNKPTNGTLQFYGNDSQCMSQNATINDIGISYRISSQTFCAESPFFVQEGLCVQSPINL